MRKDDVLTVKDAVHKLQLFLLEGIKYENQLIAAGSLLSRGDYKDVVTERTIANFCGYPLCTNSLPSERPSKGRYRVSLKEHKVYDLQETYMYCSTSCLINSRAFAASFQEERSSSLNPAKLNEVLKLFDGLSSDSDTNTGEIGDLGLSRLKIKEKTDATGGEVSLEEWIGPSNAIDGYVPRRDQNLEAKKSMAKHRQAEANGAGFLSHDMDFTSTIITNEYSISKTAPHVKDRERKVKESTKEVNRQANRIQKPIQNSNSNVNTEDVKITVLEDTTGPSQYDISEAAKELEHLGKELKSSFKISDSKNETRSVTWADGKNLNEYKELKDNHSTDEEVGQELYRFASAEACARALSQAAEAVALGKSEAFDAVSEAGVVIMPPPHEENGVKLEENGDVTDTDPLQLKWPLKPGFSNDDLFDSDESWYDSPPEGFNLALSPFSTMFMALFTWISSSSLAYIYGKEESFHEEYLSVNGREYPCKIAMHDGRSSEIKQTLAACLSRAMPGLAAELRLPIPISVLEQGMGRLVDTMSFIDPLPGFRMKQWQVIALVFLDALSVTRIPALTPHMLARRILLPKVLEGSEMSVEEFEILKDLMIPLGRVPQFSTQNGG